ncbi:hypothetical protein JTL93_34550, partial [Pseudomonas aeruginosa]|nr:hypothetical protein [Pseudomonas aeruginosa]
PPWAAVSSGRPAAAVQRGAPAAAGVLAGTPLHGIASRRADAAAGIQHPQRSRPQLRQQRFQILPEDRLTQLAFCGAVNIARKLFSNVIEIAILHE